MEKKNKRVFLIVLDSFGIGELPDAAKYGDEGSHTLRSVASSPFFHAPVLSSLGLFHIFGNQTVREPFGVPMASFGRAAERSAGKDTTSGHWEIAGLISETSMPTYPDGFPDEVLDAVEKATGRGILCNRPYSGTQVIADYEKEHKKTGKPIIYTSADSVFQVAAHEDVMSLEELYDYCQKARAVLTGKHAVGRVIARPFRGAGATLERTAMRRDFSLLPPKKTLLNVLSEAGYDTIGVGKIGDIFAMSGLTESYPTHSNTEGMEKTSELQKRDFRGLCFVNLVEFDSLYGHRNDSDGYAKAISAFDKWLGTFLSGMRSDDLLIVTADHGCDPGTPSTDHSREYIPILCYCPSLPSRSLTTRPTYADIGKTVSDWLSVPSPDLAGHSFASQLLTGMPEEGLAALALRAKQTAYVPYTGKAQGAVLLTEDGKTYSAGTIENADPLLTLSAVRAALGKAVSAGEREFVSLALTLPDEAGASLSPACRASLREFCDDDLRMLWVRDQNDFDETVLGKV